MGLQIQRGWGTSKDCSQRIHRTHRRSGWCVRKHTTVCSTQDTIYYWLWAGQRLDCTSGWHIHSIPTRTGSISRPSSTQTPTSCGDYTKLCTAYVARQKPGRNTWPRCLQTSVSNDYSRSPMSTPTARCTSWSTWTTSCSSANPKRSHVSSRRYRPRCYCDTQALVQQARQSTSLVDESQTKETTLKFHSTTATPTTYYKQPTYSRRHQQFHQEQQLPRPHLNKRSYSTSRNMPNTDAWSESYNGFHTHDLTWALQ